MSRSFVIISLLVLVIFATGVYAMKRIANLYGIGAHSEVAVANDRGEISPQTVVQKLIAGKSIKLLDVRTPEEYAEVHIDGATLIPVNYLSEESLSRAGFTNKDEEIAVYCRSGVRSAEAQAILKEYGYTNVQSVSGGIQAWQGAGLPYVVEKEAVQ